MGNKKNSLFPGVILVGGKSKRMGGNDKALIKLGASRLIDKAFKNFRPQVSEIIISGPGDYGLGVPSFTDIEGPPYGPLGGVKAAAAWLRENRKSVEYFATIPVDSPFFPGNLVKALGKTPPSYAAVSERDHPVFAVWPTALEEALAVYMKTAENPCLMGLLDALKATRVVFNNPDEFLNINRPKDLILAEKISN